jgi:hypothetical protein
MPAMAMQRAVMMLAVRSDSDCFSRLFSQAVLELSLLPDCLT